MKEQLGVTPLAHNGYSIVSLNKYILKIIKPDA